MALALKLLKGEAVETDPSASQPNTVLLVPVIADNLTDEGKATLDSWQSVKGLTPTWPLGLEIPGWTTYTPDQAVACKGPERLASPPVERREGCRFGGAPRLTARQVRGPMTLTATGLLLEAADISKTYGAVVALKSASLAVVPGEVHALMGANGAGKSTLVKILTGAVRPDGGTIAVRGRELHRPLAGRSTPRRDRVGLPGAGAHPGPRHPIQPPADRDAVRAVPSLARRARAQRPRSVEHGAAAAARLAPHHRPGAGAGHRARRPHARRDDRRPARQPDRARPRGHRQPPGRRSLGDLHLPPDDRDRRRLRPGDRAARGRDGRCRRRDRGLRGADRGADARQDRRGDAGASPSARHRLPAPST